MLLKAKHVLLIGASGGIGQAIARELDKAGASLLLVGRNEEKLTQLEHTLCGHHRIIVADINRVEGRASVVRQCQQHALDIYINAAGVMDFQLYEQQQAAAIEAMMSTNLVSPMLLCQQLLPLLQQRPQAAIINIGSIFGSIGHPGFTAYCASKFGLRGFTEALQRELADTAIKVSYLAPRATRTHLNSTAVTALNEALGNTIDTPEQVARQLIKILSGKQMQHVMGWPEKLFIQLNGLFPSLVHHALVKKLAIIRRYANANSRRETP